MNSIIGEPHCGTCKYMVEFRGASFCCRNPPTPVTLQNSKGEMNTQSVFAPVNPTATWCGEHSVKIHLAS